MEWPLRFAKKRFGNNCIVYLRLAWLKCGAIPNLRRSRVVRLSPKSVNRGTLHAAASAATSGSWAALAASAGWAALAVLAALAAWAALAALVRAASAA